MQYWIEKKKSFFSFITIFIHLNFYLLDSLLRGEFLLNAV